MILRLRLSKDAARAILQGRRTQKASKREVDPMMDRKTLRETAKVPSTDAGGWLRCGTYLIHSQGEH